MEHNIIDRISSLDGEARARIMQAVLAQVRLRACGRRCKADHHGGT
jgi:hypothetical protein